MVSLRFSLFDFIERKDSRQLAISNKAAIPVQSSIIVALLNPATLIEVSTIRQNPNRLVEVFNIWGDLLLFGITHRIPYKIHHLLKKVIHCGYTVANGYSDYRNNVLGS